MEGMQEKTSDYKPARAENGQLLPGHTANPNGRPKGELTLIPLLRAKLAEVPKGEKKTYAILLIDKLINKALEEGDLNAIKDVVDRIDGKALQRQEVDMTLDGMTSIAEAIKTIADKK